MSAFGGKAIIRGSFEQTSPGTHQLLAAYSGPEPIEIVCPPGSSVFIEIKSVTRGLFDGGVGFEVEFAQRDAMEGRQDIIERDWMVAISD